MIKELAKFIVTVCYIGKIKYAPGTFGSLAAFPVCYGIMHFVLVNQIIFYIEGFNMPQQQILSLLIIELIATLILFFIGVYFTSIYISDNQNQDPKEVVIDELVGQMLVVIFASMSIIFTYNTEITHINIHIIDFVLLFISPFIMFRIFDIKKPWPINWIDQNVKGAIGVMLDDIIAALFAIVVHYAFVIVMTDFLMSHF